MPILKFLCIALVFVVTLTAGQAPKWVVFQPENSELPSKIVRKSSPSNDKTMWLAVGAYGLARFDGSTWHVYNSENSNLPGDEIHAINTEGPKIWVGTFGDGLACLSPDAVDWTAYSPDNSGLPHFCVQDIEVGKDGTVWIASGDEGLVKFSGGNWEVFNKKNSGLKDNIIYDIELDAKGNVWMGTENGGVNMLSTKGKWKTYHTGNSPITDDWISSLSIDPQGRVWAATLGGGLMCMEGKKWRSYETGNSDIPSDAVYAVRVDKNGNVWLGTVGGLVKYNHVSWTVYNSDNSEMPGDFVNSLAIDENDNKIIGVFKRGLAIYNEKGVTL